MTMDDDDFLTDYSLLLRHHMMNSLVLSTAATQSLALDTVRSHRRVEDISNTAFATSLREILSAGRHVRNVSVKDYDTDRDVDVNRDKEKSGGYMYEYMPLAVC